MELMSIVEVHGGQHTENIRLHNSNSHFQNTNRKQSRSAEHSSNSSSYCTASQHLSSEVGDDVEDHVTCCQVSSKTNSEGDGAGEEGDLKLLVLVDNILSEVSVSVRTEQYLRL